MNERILILRKTLDLTQEEFSSKIGIERSTLSGIENYNATITERTILLICSVFKVNRNWLETGEGEMFEDFNPIYDEFFKIYNSLKTPLQDFLLDVAISLLDTQDKL